MTAWPKTWLAAAPGRVCPACGRCSGRPILWGMPSDLVFEALERDEIDISIGGCCIADDDPTHECVACEARFGRSTQGPPRAEIDEHEGTE